MKRDKRLWAFCLFSVVCIAGFVTMLMPVEPQRAHGATPVVSDELLAPVVPPQRAIGAKSAIRDPSTLRAGGPAPSNSNRSRPAAHAVYMGDSMEASIPELDRALDSGDRDGARESELLDDARRLLAKEPTVRDLSARCSATFCRLRIDRSVEADWERIDMALRPIMIGEMVFQTKTAADGTSLAFAYVSNPNFQLPLSHPDPEPSGS